MKYTDWVSSLSSPFHRKIIEVKIIDDEEYEKNKSFIIELGEPILLEIGQKHGETVLCLFGPYCVQTEYKQFNRGKNNERVTGRKESLLKRLSSVRPLSSKQCETFIDCLKPPVETQINLGNLLALKH